MLVGIRLIFLRIIIPIIGSVPASSRKLDPMLIPTSLLPILPEPSSSGVGGIVDIPDSEPPLGASAMTAHEEDDLAARVAGAKIAASSTADPLAGGNTSSDEIPDIQDIPDMDDEDELGGMGGGDVEEENDPATATTTTTSTSNQDTGSSSNNILSVRTYDCLITYDKYYQTPRMWLIGYNESGSPLKPTEIFQDISSDYAQKTVTIEPFPHTSGLSTASVHPCKHANVMKKVIERMDGTVRDEQRKARNARNLKESNGNSSKDEEAEKKKKKGWSAGLGGAMKKVTGKEKDSSTLSTTSPSSGGATSPALSGEGSQEEETEVEGLRVDQYMIIFLKFMASIVPAIEIDATQAV